MCKSCILLNLILSNLFFRFYFKWNYFKVSFPDCILLMYRNTPNFVFSSCILQLCWIVFSSNRFFMDSLRCSMYKVMPSVHRDCFKSFFFFNLNNFYLFFLTDCPAWISGKCGIEVVWEGIVFVSDYRKKAVCHRLVLCQV